MNRVLKIRVLKRLFCDFCPQLPGSNLRLDPKAVDVRNWPWGPRCLSKKFLVAADSASGEAKKGVAGAYSTVMNNPKASAAVVLGTGLAAGIWWVLRDPERVAALKKVVAERADKYPMMRRVMRRAA